MFVQQQILVKESKSLQGVDATFSRLLPTPKKQNLKSKIKHQSQPPIIASSKQQTIYVRRPQDIKVISTARAISTKDVIQPSIITHNIQIYNTADGVYNSF
jgi:hypothetical protein